MTNKNRCRQKIIFGIIVLFIGLAVSPGIIHTAAENVEKIQSGSETITFFQDFSEPMVTKNEQYVKVNVQETNSFIAYEEAPMMPFYSKTYEFTPGTKITNVEITPSKTKTMTVEKHIEPVPSKQIIDGEIVSMKRTKNQEIYGSSEPYPREWCSYNTGAGLNKDNEHVLFLSMHLYPVRYSPLERSIEYTTQIKVNITYERSEVKEEYSDNYDLVIVTPSEFYSNLASLVSHKNSYGIETNLVTLEEIYGDFSGRDSAEKIKYFIKHAVEEWDTHYVLLVGSVKKLPIRTTYASWWEADILSDLYYGDIYDSEYQFCSWDANENNRFGEVDSSGFPPETDNIDGVDLYADVHIGRLACTNQDEVDIAVNKIINYENTAYDQLWFKKIVLAGGDTFPPGMGALPFVYEGEVTNRKVAQQLPDFEHIKLWSSKHKLNAITFNRAISKGVGFVSYSGHGFEHGWGTYKANSLKRKMSLAQPLYYTPFVEYLRNQNKLPIIFFDACLTAKLDFNITDLEEYYPKQIKFLKFFKIIDYDPSNFYTCFAWSFVKKEEGGAIATVGSTRTAYTWVDKDGVHAGAGYLDVHFFKAYEEGVTAGEMLTQAQNDYINNVFRDYFTIEEFILLGDPSLGVGGQYFS